MISQKGTNLNYKQTFLFLGRTYLILSYADTPTQQIFRKWQKKNLSTFLFNAIFFVYYSSYYARASTTLSMNSTADFMSGRTLTFENRQILG